MKQEIVELVNQKHSSRGVLEKRCSENMQQIYRRKPMPKCDFKKVASQLIEISLWHGCSPVILLHMFRTPFPRNTSGWLLLVDTGTVKEKKNVPSIINPLSVSQKKVISLDLS